MWINKRKILRSVQCTETSANQMRYLRFIPGTQHKQLAIRSVSVYVKLVSRNKHVQCNRTHCCSQSNYRCKIQTGNEFVFSSPDLKVQVIFRSWSHFVYGVSVHLLFVHLSVIFSRFGILLQNQWSNSTKVGLKHSFQLKLA